MKMGLIGAAVVGLLIIGAAAVTCAKLTTIHPGHVGVSVKKCAGGSVRPEPIATGYYWRELFCEEVVPYPTSLQTLILTRAST